MRKQPKTKLEEFKEQIDNAQSKEQIEKILKRLETYTKLYPSDEGHILLSMVVSS